MLLKIIKVQNNSQSSFQHLDELALHAFVFPSPGTPGIEYKFKQIIVGGEPTFAFIQYKDGFL
ncbi:MAG: hypothetical protein HQM12_05355 [SAR324 cluster bacterium]|nr:hypothetical protein [SAR324 cluster bacterium]